MSTTTSALGGTATPGPLVPRLPRGRGLVLGARRIGYETKVYFRAGDTVFFTFLFPIVMLSIFSVAFSNLHSFQGTGPNSVTAAEYYLPGMIAAGILLSGVQNLAVDIATEKGDGTLKRLGGSPLPVLSYFTGKIGQVFATSLLQVLLLLAVAHFAFNVPLPTDPAKWATFAWIYVLGIVTCATLGIALSGLPRTGKSATAVIIPITLVLQFISGVYLAFSELPTWLQNIASIFPLKWIAQGMRSVFLPEVFAAAEPGGSWNLQGILIVLLIWLVVGIVVSRMTFRWIRKDR